MDRLHPRTRRRSSLATVAVGMLLVALLGGALVGCSGDKKDDAKKGTSKPKSTTTSTQVTATMQPIQILSVDTQFQPFIDLIGTAGLKDILDGEGPFTIFAPSNEAFAAMDQPTLADLKTDPVGKLRPFLERHIVKGEFTYTDLLNSDGKDLPTLAGSPVKVSVNGDKVSVGGAIIAKSDIRTRNGWIHVLGAVISG